MSPTLCSNCAPLCDHCRWFDYNGDDGVYTGDGYCRRHRRPTHPDQACDDYHCKNVPVDPSKPPA